MIDEEQHFGVKHKERLKELRANVHVLTLTATPIPRTLQLALSGVRELSLITTPPLDRLAVRTFISPFDPVIVREHLLREHLSRRPELLRRAAHRRSRGHGGVPPHPGAGSQVRGGAWPDGGNRARRRDDGVLRAQIRRAALHHHRRVRARHSERQHAHRPPRRHVRAGAALPAAGAGRDGRSSGPMRC